MGDSVRRGVWCLLVAALALVVSGCGGSAARVDGDEKEVTERVGNWWVHRGVDKFTDEEQKPAAFVFSKERQCVRRESQHLSLMCAPAGGVRSLWVSGCDMGGSTVLRIDLRVGHGKAWSESWVSSGDGAVQMTAAEWLEDLGPPQDTPDNRRLFKAVRRWLLTRMEKADIPRLLIRGGGREAEFDITGIRAVAPLMAEACGGK